MQDSQIKMIKTLFKKVKTSVYTAIEIYHDKFELKQIFLLRVAKVRLCLEK